MATAGLREGRNPTNDAVYSDFEYRPSISFAAVPVFPAIVKPEICALLAVPWSTTPSMIDVNVAAVSPETVRRSSFGLTT